MKKKSLIFIYLIFSPVLFGQSKKEQIQMLTFRVDSINSILSSERNTIAQKELGYTSKISNLENQVTLLKSEIELLNKNLLGKDLEIKNLNNELIKTKNENDFLNNQLIILNEKYNHLPNNLLTIDVTNKFNDFNIKIFWILAYGFPGDNIIGPATIEFKKNNGETYYVQNNNFSLPIKDLPLQIQYEKDSSFKFNLTKSKISKSYPQKILTSFDEPSFNDMNHSTYFMFLLDIDFDGNPELFMMGENEAQRGCWSYKPIFFESNEVITKDLYYEFNGRLNLMKLDALSLFNNRDKSIKLRYSNGAFDSFAEIFKWDGYGYKFYKKERNLLKRN